MIKDIDESTFWDYAENLYVFNGQLFFAANDRAHGLELWKTNGTDRGTVLKRDIYLGPAESSPRLFTEYNGDLFFVARDGNDGNELRRLHP